MDDGGQAAARRSPPTERVVRILAHLAASPRRSYGLSELARALGLGKATCLAILNELTIAGFVVREPTAKTYSLGAEAVLLGYAAQDAAPALQAARAAADTLAAELGLGCTVSTVIDDVHVVLARSGPREDSDPTVRVGQRFPFAPPWGTANVAWDTDAAVAAWLAKAPVVPVEIDRDHLRDVVDDARRRGHLVEVATDAGRQLNAALAHLSDVEDRVVDLVLQVTSSLGYREYLLEDVVADHTYDVTMLGAPTYDRAGRQELLVALFGFRHLRGDELRGFLDRLREAAATVTRTVGGRDPWS
jgi:DNA-binding IclR family transcriptional regulator